MQMRIVGSMENKQKLFLKRKKYERIAFTFNNELIDVSVHIAAIRFVRDMILSQRLFFTSWAPRCRVKTF